MQFCRILSVFLFLIRIKRAKHIVKEKASLIKKLRPVDAGGTLSARHIEHIVAFLIGLNSRYRTHDCGFTVSGLPVKEW
jgi:predicted dinucleotide-binding enzyme